MRKRISEQLNKKDMEPFIIAEAGINHNGDINLARKMIRAAKEAGADAVKFQTFQAEEFVQDKTLTYTYQSQGVTVTESMLEMFKRNEFSKEEWKDLKAFCDKEEITFLSTPENNSDLELLIPLGIEAVKVGSDDFTNLPLMRDFAGKGLPMMISCGMADEEEIAQTLQVVRENSHQPIVLFLCTSEYPTPPEDVNLLKLTSIADKFPYVIPGLSDHTEGSQAAIAAVALGARVFEKHFTMDHNLPGPDHWFSAEPEELKNWIGSIRTTYKMLGSQKLIPTEKEREMRDLARRSITTSKQIGKGEVFDETNLCMRRPGTGIPGRKWDEVIGKKAARDIAKGIQLQSEDIDD